MDYAAAINDAGGPIKNCIGFTDSTVREISNPAEHPRLVYKGHHRVYAIKFQSVVSPDGLLLNLVGPWLGIRHDSRIFQESGVKDLLKEKAVSPPGNDKMV